MNKVTLKRIAIIVLLSSMVLQLVLMKWGSTSSFIFTATSFLMFGSALIVFVTVVMGAKNTTALIQEHRKNEKEREEKLIISERKQ